MAAIGCTSNQEGKALRDVQQACINLGFGGSDSGDGSDDDAATTSKELTDLSDSMDETANTVARAARIDPRWNRLSNAVTDGQEWAKQMAIARDQTQTELDRSTAQEQADQLEPLHLAQVMRQECRKAQA
ncbi:hypothetical protein AB0D91_48275 [Streptomyces canus]|uniref:hypothetical protein n=1 Tax=Streptomyces canus TaxID=58343 RepID=UPI0033D6898D